MHVGAANRVHPIESGLWTTAMLHNAQLPPPMIEDDFVGCHNLSLVVILQAKYLLPTVLTYMNTLLLIYSPVSSK